MTVDEALGMAETLKREGVVSRFALGVICLGDEVRLLRQDVSALASENQKLRQQATDIEALDAQPYIEPVELELHYASE